MLSIAMLFILNTVLTVTASSAKVFDGAPCIELLIDMVNSIAAEDYGRFSWSLWWFTQVEPPNDVAYLHNRTGILLKELASHLRGYVDRRSEVLGLAQKGRCSEAEQLLDDAKRLFLDVYRVRIRLVDEELLKRYANAMMRYVDSYESVLLEKSFRKAVDNFVSYIEALKLEIIRLQNEVLRCRAVEWVELNIYIDPETVEAGGSINVSGEVVGSPTDSSGTYFKVLLRIGGAIVRQVDVPGMQRFSIALPVPGVEELRLSMGSESGVGARVEVFYFSRDTLLAYNTSVVEIVVHRPRVVFECPSSVGYSESIAIPVKAEIEHPLNITVYLDGEKIYNGMLYPTTSMLFIGWGNSFTPGYHTLIFEIVGRGKYATTRSSCALAITVKQPSFDVAVDPLSLYPFSSGIKVVGKIAFPEPVDYIIEIVLDGEKRTIAGFGREQPLNLSLSPIPPLVMKFSDLRIRVSIPELGLVFETSHSATTVNILGLIGLLFMLLLALIAPPRRDVLELPTLFLEKLRSAIPRKATEKKGNGFKQVVVRITFKPSRLAPLYYSILGKVSRRVGEMLPSETLREYLRRVERYLEDRVLEPFRRITFLFEKDLYSKQGVSEEEVLEAKRVGEVLEGEA